MNFSINVAGHGPKATMTELLLLTYLMHILTVIMLAYGVILQVKEKVQKKVIHH